MINTNEGANAYEHSMNHALEFFAKAGSLYASKKNSFYGNESTAKELFINSFIADRILSMKLLLWLRDCRGGAGNRSGARSIIEWLGANYPEWMSANMHLIPVHGRWDDLRALFKTQLRQEAGRFWANAITNGDVLAAKWCKRHYKPVRQALKIKEATFRRMLARIRKDHIVEHKMCQKNWSEIDYKTVPSVAMARYTKCFAKNDNDRFQAYKEAIKRGEATVHADVLFPHDCIRTVKFGDRDMGALQFDSLPNYMKDSNENVMVICDTSGSMEQPIGGNVEAIDVSMGMALYCSSRVPVDSPFYKRFIAFKDESKFVDWREHTFDTALYDRKVFDRAVGATRIDKALDLILNVATTRNIKQELMPTTLLIVSDMQFHDGAVSTRGFGYGIEAHESAEKKSLTEIERCLKKWDEAGYDRPKIVYWNTAGYKGSQDTLESNNVGLVSGFSPAILESIFDGEDFSPMAIMYRAIEKYEIVDPTLDI